MWPLTVVPHSSSEVLVVTLMLLQTLYSPGVGMASVSLVTGSPRSDDYHVLLST